MRTKKIIIVIALLILSGHEVFSQNITNTLGTTGMFTIKDASTNYLTLSQSTGQVNILRTLRLESSLSLSNTAGSNLGVIYKGSDRFLHNYGVNNTFLGVNSGNFYMTGNNNTALGFRSLLVNTAGFNNTSLGRESLYSNTTGADNTAVGSQSLYLNIDGINNTAMGGGSLYSNTSGIQNTAVGWKSLFNNTLGDDNTAVGNQSLFLNTIGNYNTAVGGGSLFSNTDGLENTAVGWQSLFNNTTGGSNTAIGMISMHSNTIGHSNTALGHSTLTVNISGFDNTALGYNALNLNTTGRENTAVGHASLQNNTAGFQNTTLGRLAGSSIVTGNNLSCFGFDSRPTTSSASNQVTLGNNEITSLRCNVQTITSLSDARDKKNIQDLSLGIDFIMKIKPRLFNWDKREWYENNLSDGSKIKEVPTAGFIAQELDEVQTKENAEWLNLVLKDNPEKLEATYGNLLPVMVKAIQELKVENEKLSKENVILKNDDKETKERLLKLEQAQNRLINELEKSRTNKITVVKNGD